MRSFSQPTAPKSPKTLSASLTKKLSTAAILLCSATIHAQPAPQQIPSLAQSISASTEDAPISAANSPALQSDPTPTASPILPEEFPTPHSSTTPPPTVEEINTAQPPPPSAGIPQPPSGIRIVINLSKQRLTLFHDNTVLLESPISSGRTSSPTSSGNFEVVEKDLNHHSTLYGQIVRSASGAVVRNGANSSMPIPKGCRFKPALMKYFLRFNGAEGMHAGVLPGYAASHGCIRLPTNKAAAIFKAAEIGTPVIITGATPKRSRQTKNVRKKPASSAIQNKPIPTPPPQKKQRLFFFGSQKKN